jgi:glycine hydroxymethyltransferase
MDSFYKEIAAQDKEIYQAILNENQRQRENLELIASENFVSRAVLEAYATTFTNKYAEGYPGKRYYTGCQNMDVVENLAIERAKKLFKAPFANVQPHSGAQANMAVFFSALNMGDTFLGMDLAHGGHLSHGSKVNFSGKYFKVVSYGVRKDTECIDYSQLESLAMEHKPKLILAGASAYPREIDFAKFREIADKAGARLLVDMAHIAGLVATGLHPDPMPYADYVTTTTHKTLRGPRGGLILSKEEYGKDINSKVFPGMQGGPLMHVILAKAVALGEALRPDFKDYQKKVIANAKALAETISARGYRIVSGGTDNHLILVDLTVKKLTGKDAANRLDEAGITVNKNGIPFDPNPPAVSGGIRLGSPALTTRGMGQEEIKLVGKLICDCLDNLTDDRVIQKVRGQVRELASHFPMDKFQLE